jgi:uncharacterized protein
MNPLQVTCDLFSIPHQDGRQILYAPRLGFAGLANRDLVNLLARLEEVDADTLNDEQRAAIDSLQRQGILNGTAGRGSSAADEGGEFLPTQVTLFPSNECNLRCTYCYATAGEGNRQRMSMELAQGAIEALIRCVKKRGMRQITVGFHGGGEPLLHWRWVQAVVAFAEERARAEGLTASFHSATNGVLNERMLEWLRTHFSSLNISFDGLPEVQDRQRPLANGRGSFSFVDRTLRHLDKHNFPYAMRCTVSTHNLGRMEESVEFLARNYKVKSVQMEPLSECGRCATTGDVGPDLGEFAAAFERSRRVAAGHGIRLTYSGCDMHGLRSTFCGAVTDNFAVTPQGYITTCFEVAAPEDPRAGTFFIGRVTEAGELLMEEGRRSYLRGLKVENLDYCRDCFAKWHCAGDCLTKIGHTDYAGRRGHPRCQVNRHLLKGEIVAALDRAATGGTGNGAAPTAAN